MVARRKQPAAGAAKAEQQREREALEEEEAEEAPVRGVQAWLRAYAVARPGFAALKRRYDAQSLASDARAASEEAGRLAASQTQDGDGWTLVVHRKGRKKATAGVGGTKVSGVASAAAAALAGRAKKKTLSNFYKFQAREKKRSEVLELREKFEADKRKMKRMRQERNAFSPY